MRRRSSNVIAVTCLLLSLCASALWAWSFADHIFFHDGRLLLVNIDSEDLAEYCFTRGGAHTMSEARMMANGIGWSIFPEIKQAGDDSTHCNVAGFESHRGLVFVNNNLRRPYLLVSLNLLAPAIAFALVPFVWVARAIVLTFQKRRRLSIHHCASCGYNLKHTPKRCPECGARPAKISS